MATILGLWNQALTQFCGESKLASTTEARLPKTLLEDAWNDGAIKTCLEKGQWRFASRTRHLTYDGAYSSTFGYQYRFLQPSDWVLKMAVCSDEYLKLPLLDYSFEGTYWYCDLQDLYVKYVSDDSTFGSDLNLWPETFKEYVAAFLAEKIIRSLTSNENKVAAVERMVKEKLSIALNKNASMGPTKFPTEGSWTRSRGISRGEDDLGNKGSLIG